MIRRLPPKATLDVERYLEASARVAELAHFEREKRDAKAAILEHLGEETLGQLPDGRLVLATSKSRTDPPREEKQYTWKEITIQEPE